VNKLTASKLELATSCPSAFSLAWRDDRTVDSDTGRANHAALERRIIEGDIPEALTTTFPNVTQWFAETRMAWNVATHTGRIIGHGGGRDYSSLGPTEMGGTNDVYGVDGDRVIVVDWKLRYFTKAEENLQLRWYAMTLASALGLKFATVAIFPEVGAPSIAELDDWHFDAFATRLEAITLAVNKPTTEYNVGPQCRHCPAFLSCPQNHHELALVKSGATDIQILSLPLETDEGAAATYDLLVKLETLAKRVRSAVIARSMERPIPLSGGLGLVYGPRPVAGARRIDGDKAYELIRSTYNQEIADAAVTRDATQVSIKAAFAAAKIAPEPEMKKLMKMLESAGAVTQKDSVKIEAHVPRALKAAV